MNNNAEVPKRKNHRLINHDYGNKGYYYVTICTYNKECILSNIVGSDALVAPTEIGKIVIKCWNNIEKLNPNVKLDKFVLMPNHIHGIIFLDNAQSEISMSKEFDFNIPERRGRRSLQGLIKDFKSVTTRIYKKKYGLDHSLWQASFYDEVIKSEKHYLSISNYILRNPAKWQFDKYNKFN